MEATDKSKTEWAIRQLIRINSLLVLVVAVGLFLYPAVRATLDLQDPALSGSGTPKVAWRLYRNLTPRYARWAKQRVAEGRAEGLSIQDISGTEWPLFGSVFYLWGLENLQAAWDAGDHQSQHEPRVFARDAITAASELVIDPRHASWVKKHWGDDYLHRENVFYRMLVIAALTSRERLLHDGAHLDLLRDQVESFASELSASKTGLLDDYPGECYPGDVMAAIMCIKRADRVLGTDHSQFVAKSLRGFTGPRATRHQLPPYSANSANGSPTSPARGCANSYMCLTSPELWPAQAKQWYALHDRFFWQRRIGADGFREFPKDLVADRTKSVQDGIPTIGPPAYHEPSRIRDWGMDVDSGPVIAGHGVAASAFGVGAARKNGRFDQAYPLAAEMLVTTWEMPGGALGVPRLLSNVSDAPLLGEAAIFWLLSIQPEKGFAIQNGGILPPYVYLVLIAMLLIGTWLSLQALWKFGQARCAAAPEVRAPRLQIGTWIGLAVSAVVMFCYGHGLIALALILPTVLLPRVKRQKPPKGTEDWPSAPAETVLPPSAGKS